MKKLDETHHITINSRYLFDLLRRILLLILYAPLKTEIIKCHSLTCHMWSVNSKQWGKGCTKLLG